MCCQLNQCCCGYSLQTGTTAISVFSLISSVVSIIQDALVISAPQNAKMLYNLSVGQLVVAVVTIVMTILVLVAAVKNRMPNLMLPWLVVEIVNIIVSISFLIVLARTGAVEVVDYIIDCVGGALGFYFWLVVLSYYQELKGNATTEQLPDGKATRQIQRC